MGGKCKICIVRQNCWAGYATDSYVECNMSGDLNKYFIVAGFISIMYSIQDVRFSVITTICNQVLSV